MTISKRAWQPFLIEHAFVKIIEANTYSIKWTFISFWERPQSCNKNIVSSQCEGVRASLIKMPHRISGKTIDIFSFVSLHGRYQIIFLVFNTFVPCHVTETSTFDGPKYQPAMDFWEACESSLYLPTSRTKIVEIQSNYVCRWNWSSHTIKDYICSQFFHVKM